MTFTWNEDMFRWIEEHESCDEFKYIVVRKMYVEFELASIVSLKTMKRNIRIVFPTITYYFSSHIGCHLQFVQK